MLFHSLRCREVVGHYADEEQQVVFSNVELRALLTS